MSEGARASVAVPGVVKDGGAERRRFVKKEVPTGACFLCGDRERLAPEPLEFRAGLDVLESAWRPDILLCPTCAAAQRGAVQRGWALAALAPAVCAALVVAVVWAWPVHALLVGALLLASLVALWFPVQRLIRRARERAVPLAWLDIDEQTLTLQVPTWDKSGEPPARLVGLSPFLPYFLTALLALPVAWITWASVTPLISLDNPQPRACTFVVDGGAITVKGEQRETVRVARGAREVLVECEGERVFRGDVEVRRRTLISTRSDVCYTDGWLVHRGPVAHVDEDALRVPCPAF